MHFPYTAPRNYERRGNVDHNMAVREIAPRQNGDRNEVRKEKDDMKFLILDFPVKALSGREY